MNKLKKARELSIFKRKIILFSALFVLAVPMTILIVRALTDRVAVFNGKRLINKLEVTEEIGESFLQVQETKAELDELMNQIPDMSTTTNTSTDILLSTTTFDFNN